MNRIMACEVSDWPERQLEKIDKARLELTSVIRKLFEFKCICVNFDKILSVIFVLSTPKTDAIL